MPTKKRRRRKLKLHSDLNEASLTEAIRLLGAAGQNLAFHPSQILITEEGLANARALAKADPEFARRVLAELKIDLLSVSSTKDIFDMSRRAGQ